MAYNLRPRPNTISEELLQSEEEEFVGGDGSDSEDDVVSEQSESEVSSEDELSEAENASLNTRLLASNARGRPRSTLRGADGFKWITVKPTRTSGNK